ncbi:MAG TPA: glycosyltransferase family 2 protein [Dongiaceae bacterium]|nr:glycosyltransferase family 2 protein [Dongiaceae bacterium]
MREPRISLIVSTYNAPLPLAKVFAGLARQSRRPHEILISDDGSGPPTRELIQQWTPQLGLRHIWHEDDGFRKTIILNKSLAATTGDYVVLLDGDCVPHRHFIRDHLAVAEPNFWVQGRRCFVREPFVPDFAAGETSVLAWWLRGRVTGAAKAVRLPFPLVQRNCKQRGIIGCNMGFWREDLLAVNGFDEDYTGWGIGEDSDLGTRLYHLGRPRKFVHNHAIIYHLDHPSLPKAHVPDSLKRLQQTIDSGKVRCERGVSQYL